MVKRVSELVFVLQEINPLVKVETRLFADDGKTPNHPLLPLVVMRGTGAQDAPDPAAWFEQRFQSHGWGGVWRWTVYPYHHYHTTNHEVLGVARGEATLELGGEHGAVFQVAVGDVIVIPAGVGHKRLASTEDFQVVGAYPEGREPDLVRSGEGDIQAARERIQQVLFPRQDPVHGTGGPLFNHWSH